MVLGRIILYFLLSATRNSAMNQFQKCLQTAREMQVAALLSHVGLWVVILCVWDICCSSAVWEHRNRWGQGQVQSVHVPCLVGLHHLTPAVSMGMQAKGYKMCRLCSKVECDSFHVQPPWCIFSSAITTQVHDVRCAEEQYFRQPWRISMCLPVGLGPSVLVVPDVDPLWSRVGRVCRQLCNYAVSMTY